MVSSKVTHICEIMTCFISYDAIDFYMTSRHIVWYQNVCKWIGILARSLVIIALLVKKLQRGGWNPHTAYSIVGRGVLTLTFYEDPHSPPLYCLPTFFKFSPILSPPSLPPPSPTPTAHSVVLFLWQNEWSSHIWCAILLNDIMDVHMSSLRTLMRILCNKATRHQVS